MLFNNCVNNNQKLWGDLYPESNYFRAGIAGQMAESAYEVMGLRDGGIDLIITLIISAGKDRDFDYLHSEMCEKDCEMIGLDYNRAIKSIRHLCDYLDFGTGVLDEARY